jgi:hypothetical protein
VNQDEYFGDENCFIFSLVPVCRSYRPADPLSFRNFVYFSTRDKPGLGFGGSTPDKCRIWIDPKMTTHSYATDEADNTYCSGPLAQGSTRDNFQITDVEIWVFGDQSLQTQVESNCNQ